MITVTSTDPTESWFIPRLNRLIGHVIWIQKGLQGVTLKLRVGNTLNLKIRSETQAMESASFSLGQWLVVNIPQESVYLLPSDSSLFKKRWTRWEGRIVLASRPENDSGVFGPMAVKVLGEQLTLHTNRILGGKSVLTQVGDRVNIMIDPRGIRIVFAVASAGPSLSGLPRCSALPGRVRLHGFVTKIRPAKAGLFVIVQVGQAVVSAYMTGEPANADYWPMGGRVALTVGEYESWVQSMGMPMSPQPCLLLYVAGDEEAPRMPIPVPSISPKSLSQLIERGG
ncbi:MAG: hypothetical protein R3B74_16845 [Nitrospirales bacterium]|nr:hypothetical protein [Nitrospirales bacterium]